MGVSSPACKTRFVTQKAGIPELWLVDLTQEQIGVYRAPSRRGYGDSQTLRRGQILQAHFEEILG
ncbi:MAG: Uma2 family endonuclease [Candidatus Bipolaricaulota bacterium]|nr:Uma2 family endonuclease [Candidatus Bipolaricaulota bacterium]MDW8030860.1 hypothetical protein [Candidatus Bipolaricaulota bacterium]